MLKKPIAVVSVVRNTGCTLTRSDSRIASRFSSPERMPSMMVEMTCTEWAMATVMMMVGAPTLPDDNTMPDQPAKPIAVSAANRTTRRVAIVPVIERSNTAMTMKITRMMIGPRVVRSSKVASPKARLVMTLPVT